MAYGQDRDVVFVREKSKVIDALATKASLYPRTGAISFSRHEPGIRYKQLQLDTVLRNGAVYRRRTMALYFCGKLYRGICLDLNSVIKPALFFWDADSFLAFVAPENEISVSWRNWSRTPLDILNGFFGDKISDREREYLISNRISIALYVEPVDEGYNKSGNFMIDCCGLGQVGFAKVVDPYAAFQELSMWVGGVLPKPGNPMVEIVDDKIKLAKHGFDKWTFRKKKDAS
jgi:hypothetical protein